MIKLMNTRNVVGAIKYVLEESSHDGIHERVGAVGTHNMTVSGATREAVSNLKRWGKMDNIQAYMFIQSFREDELNPDNQDDLDKANQIALDTAKQMWGTNRQVLVVTQADNGKVHSHAIVVSPDLENGRSIRECNFYKARALSDEMVAKYGVKNINAEVKNDYKNRQTIAEIKRREQGLYVWKDDLKSRIEGCMADESVIDLSGFCKKMDEDYAVNVSVNGKGNIAYRFTDADGKDRRCRASKLGNIYGKDGLEYGFTDNQSKQINVELFKAERVEFCKYQHVNRKPEREHESVARESEGHSERSTDRVVQAEFLRGITTEIHQRNRDEDEKSRIDNEQKLRKTVRRNRPSRPRTYNYDWEVSSSPEQEDGGYDFEL